MKFLIPLVSLVWFVHSKSVPCSTVPEACPKATNLKCLLSGHYKEVAPKTDKTVFGYFEDLSLGDGVFSLLDTFYCPDPTGSSCPKTFARISPSEGLYSVSSVKCSKYSKRSTPVKFTLTLTPKLNSLGNPTTGLPPRNFTGHIEYTKGTLGNQLTLRELGTENSHVMMKD